MSSIFARICQCVIAVQADEGQGVAFLGTSPERVPAVREQYSANVFDMAQTLYGADGLSVDCGQVLFDYA